MNINNNIHYFCLMYDEHINNIKFKYNINEKEIFKYSIDKDEFIKKIDNDFNSKNIYYTLEYISEQMERIYGNRR